MADAAPPPPKKPGPARWILLGCGILTGLLVLGMGGCAGLFYLLYEETMPIANEGLLYLDASEMGKAFGPRYRVHRNLLGWNVQTADDAGDARIAYTVRDANQVEAGEATVWLVKNGGTWSAVGARVRPKAGDSFRLGNSPPGDRLRLKGWDD